MPDRDVHGIIYSDPPQTPCGLSTSGHRISDDPLRITCSDCIRIMKITNDMPNLDGPITQRGRGRPKKER